MSRRAHVETAEARAVGTVYRAKTAGRPGLVGVPPGDHPTSTDHHPLGVPERALLLRATRRAQAATTSRPQLWKSLWTEHTLRRAESHVNDTEELWTSCSEILRKQAGDASWRTCLSAITPLAVQDREIRLGVPNRLIRDRIADRYLGLIQDTVSTTLGRDLSVELEVTAPDDVLPDDELIGAPSELDGQRSAPTPSWGEPAVQADRSSRPVPGNPAALDRRYTFENFVIASSNRFAHAAARSVAESPGHSYNPLFIYGDAGLGKTHILHAIGNYVRENFSGRNVRYVTLETYMNEFVVAIRTNAMIAFKRRYRECDVLLIDDVQFMERKESLQEEFFHTFNSLYGASSQIVLTSDRPPKSIATLEDRLRSRFLSGLITEIQPPDLETRLAILQTKALLERVNVPDDVLEFIATHVKDNIRELEGALIRVTAFGSLYGQPLSRELAEEVLSDIVAADKPRPITPQLILAATAEAFGFSIEELRGPNRRRPLVTARQVSMYVFRELTEFSYPAIGREFGGRDHSTVIHAVEKIAGLMKERQQIYVQVTDLIVSIRTGTTGAST